MPTFCAFLGLLGVLLQLPSNILRLLPKPFTLSSLLLYDCDIRRFYQFDLILNQSGVNRFRSILMLMLNVQKPLLVLSNFIYKLLKLPLLLFDELVHLLKIVLVAFNTFAFVLPTYLDLLDNIVELLVGIAVYFFFLSLSVEAKLFDLSVDLILLCFKLVYCIADVEAQFLVFLLIEIQFGLLILVFMTQFPQFLLFIIHLLTVRVQCSQRACQARLRMLMLEPQKLLNLQC